ncbi:MAG: MnhB domain-containing protein [Desulfobacterales bacterium]|jgi:multisubunit Na+/H+ antiporter MnhB subunit|nr:MnhB domain-containing protein [Desulfobacterales bacterium]
MRSIILSTAIRLLVALILVFAVYLLWRGHHLPGGGFAAALVAASGFGLFAMAEGPNLVYQSLRIGPRQLAAAGLILVSTTGVLPMLVGKPFLTGIWWSLTPGVSLGTPLLFDIGVFLVVLGTVLSLILSLEEA